MVVIPPWLQVKILSSLKDPQCAGAEADIEEDRMGKELVEIPSNSPVTAIIVKGSENGVYPVH